MAARLAWFSLSLEETDESRATKMVILFAIRI